jgi:hypothetical protein
LKTLARMLFIGTLISSSNLYAIHMEGSLESGIGHLQGYTQIPKGGNLNSTSLERPSFDEMGLQHNVFFHADVSLHVRSFFAFVDYYRFTPSKNFTLDNSLITHSLFIPAGSTMDVSVHYNWYQGGLGYQTENLLDQWQLQFTLAANWFKLHYDFWSPIASSSRYFTQVTATAGLDALHALSEHWLIDLSGEVALPLTTLRMLQLGLGFRYLFTPCRSQSPFAQLTLGMLYLDFEDRQKLPNHFKYQLAPYVSVAIGWM